MFLCNRNIVAASCTLYSSLIIVKSLQLRGRRQITKPRKYCLVRVIVFLWRVCFFFFLFLTGWEFKLVPYNNSLLWHQTLQNSKLIFWISSKMICPHQQTRNSNAVYDTYLKVWSTINSMEERVCVVSNFRSQLLKRLEGVLKDSS